MTKGWSVSGDRACCVYQLAVTEVRILSPRRIWEAEALSFLMIIFQRNGSQVLEKNASELEEEHIHNSKPLFSKYSKRRKSEIIIRYWLEKIVNFPGYLELS